MTFPAEDRRAWEEDLQHLVGQRVLRARIEEDPWTGGRAAVLDLDGHAEVRMLLGQCSVNFLA
ncbi:MAG TPA: hypothetical protein VFD30_12905 [Terriglobia bacterium]|nr:hypothetical protein [Terriglobia bacterium]